MTTIEYKAQLNVKFVPEPDAPQRWQLMEPFEFVVTMFGESNTFVVPAGFWTDFASVPRVFWGLISPYDLGVGPIPHDFGYFTGHQNREYWDDVFLAAMQQDAIKTWRAIAAHKAVRYFGWAVWDRYRKSNTKRALFKLHSTKKWEVTPWNQGRFMEKIARGGEHRPALGKELLWQNFVKLSTTSI